jgi:hypothetical protein
LSKNESGGTSHRVTGGGLVRASHTLSM